MIDEIVKMLGGIGADIWMIICAGIIALAFIIGLIVSLIGGDLSRFKRAAKILIASPDAKAGNRSAKQMPVKVTKLYKRVRATGEKPGDVVGIDACVNTPFYTSLTARFASMMTVVSVFAVLIAAAAGFIASAHATDETAVKTALLSASAPAAVVAAVGLLLTVSAFVISGLLYKSAVKVYDRYISVLDTLSGNGGFDHISLDTPVSSVQTVAQAETVVAEAVTAEPQPAPPSFHSVKEEISYTSAGTGFSFSEPVAPAKEEYRTADRDEFSAPVLEANFEPVIFSPASSAVPHSGIATEPSVPEEPAISYPVTTAQDLRARAEQARQERAARAAEQAAQAPQGVSGSADELIARIEKVAAEGAPLSAMKEIAIQLNQERQKPENKNPETSKRLADAQIMLIRAMSSAMRK